MFSDSFQNLLNRDWPLSASILLVGHSHMKRLVRFFHRSIHPKGYRLAIGSFQFLVRTCMLYRHMFKGYSTVHRETDM